MLQINCAVQLTWCITTFGLIKLIGTATAKYLGIVLSKHAEHAHPNMESKLVVPLWLRTWQARRYPGGSGKARRIWQTYHWTELNCWTDSCAVLHTSVIIPGFSSPLLLWLLFFLLLVHEILVDFSHRHL